MMLLCKMLLLRLCQAKVYSVRYNTAHIQVYKTMRVMLRALRNFEDNSLVGLVQHEKYTAWKRLKMLESKWKYLWVTLVMHFCTHEWILSCTYSQVITDKWLRDSYRKLKVDSCTTPFRVTRVFWLESWQKLKNTHVFSAHECQLRRELYSILIMFCEMFEYLWIYHTYTRVAFVYTLSTQVTRVCVQPLV